jgi:tetratricopeptide (TPR) repeat protein
MWTPDDARKSIACAEEAIALDPDFMLAHSGLAFAHVYLGATGQANPRTAFEKGRSYALRAVELDDSQAESHVALALSKLMYDWDWEGAREEFERALALNPESSGAMLTYSLYLNAMSRLDESIRLQKGAVTIDPLSFPLLHNLGETYLLADQLDEAMEVFQRILEMSPTFRAALNGMAMVHVKREEYAEAIRLSQESRRLTGDELKGVTNLGFAYARSGDREKAEECLQILTKRQARDKDTSLGMDFALIYEGLGEYEKAIDYLEKAYEDRLGAIAFIGVNYASSPMYDHPRFRALLQKLRLPSPAP